MENPLNLLNEADVREEFITPFLTLLGYRRGTVYDILREHNLVYPYSSLGRKKKTDRLLTGRADYILSINGVGRWVIEAKPPNVQISNDDVEQALTYARHPEISASLCVITNGLETHIYEANSIAGLEPVGIEENSNPIQLATDLSFLLSPENFAHRFRRRVANLHGGFAKGMPESQNIVAGHAVYRQVQIFHNLPDLDEVQRKLDNLKNSLVDFVSHIDGGRIFIEGNSVAMLVKWSMPNAKMLNLSSDIGLGTEMMFKSQSEKMSQDPGFPTFFDGNLDLSVEKGAVMYEGPFDIGEVSELSVKSRFVARAKGVLEKNCISGEFFTELYFEFDELPGVEMTVEGTGEFKILLES